MSAFSQKVSRQEAISFVHNWLSDSGYTVKAVQNYSYNSKNSLYLIDLQPKGFIILSTDYRTKPVLAYSFEHNRVNNIQGTNIEYILNSYARQIEKITDEYRTRNQDWQQPSHKIVLTSVAPILTINWGQGSGYNLFCPEDDNGPGGHALVGCVATAAGQIMYHWATPDQGYGRHGYNHPTYGNLSADFSNTTYDWDAMQNNEMPAIALLLNHIGIAVNMNYGPTSSGAMIYSPSQNNLFSAWHGFFRYKSTHAKRQDYTDADWINLLKTDLNNNKPVLYSGFRNQQGCGGHAWVCDGYDNNDLFHMNWGWNGSYNGYYELNDLTPGANDYSLNQNILYDIEPYTEFQCVFDQYEGDSNDLYIDNNVYREGYYLSENNSIGACLTPGDEDWYVIEYDNNGITDRLDLLVKGADAQVEGNYILTTTRNGDILTIETKSYGEPTDTKIEWKCLCSNGNYPKIIMEDDNSGEDGVFSKLIIDVSQIQYTDIPDIHFKSALYDKGIAFSPFDAHILTEYINHIPELSLNYWSISDFTGIEGFENLQEFWCHHTDITSLDVSQNHHLQKLICRDNNLSSLTLNPEIIEVYGNRNNLTSLDLSYCTQLQEFDFSHNDLQDFDIRNGNYLNLSSFYLNYNPNLSCVLVDDENYFETHWSNNIPSNTIYVESNAECVALTETIPPIANCQNITINLDTNGNAIIDSSLIDNNSTDNIGITNYSLSQTNFDCNDLGDNTVTLTVEDAAGNQDSCSATVTVQDGTPPVLTTQNITANINSNGNYTINPTDLIANATDNCGIASSLTNISSLDCNNLGDNIIEVTVTDNSGNSTTANATINLLDNINPILSTQNITAYVDDNGDYTINPTDLIANATDNCGIASSLTNISGLDCNNLGDNIIEVTVTDNSGNSTTANATINLSDNIHPTAITQDIQVNLSGNPDVSIMPNDIDNGSFDNCNINAMSLSQNTFSSTGTYTVVLSVEDSSLNSDSASALVEVIDQVSAISGDSITGLKIYPNPTSSIIIIENEEEIKKIIISDISGQEIMSLKTNQSKIELNLNHFTQGIYLLKIKTNKLSSIKKIIVKSK